MFNNPFCGESVHLGKLQIKNGQLAIFPPTEVLNNPGVYNMEVNWTQSNVTRTGTAIVSVEQSLMGRGLVSQTHGPLQFSRVQTRLRDNPESNDILGGYEFTAEEFITAMLECVEYYNEVLPYGATYTVDTFPYRQHWLDATISRLLMTTAMWQQRNFVEVTGEGITSSARAKYQQLMQQSQVLWDDYRKFVAATKHAQNARSAFRIM
jgi:hypothetical protein